VGQAGQQNKRMVRCIQIRTRANDNKQWGRGPKYAGVVTSQAIVRQRWSSRRNADPRGSDQLPHSRPLSTSSAVSMAETFYNPHHGCCRVSYWRKASTPLQTTGNTFCRCSLRTARPRAITPPIEPGCQGRVLNRAGSNSKLSHRRRWSWLSPLASPSLVLIFPFTLGGETRFIV
jgi:hypothetical protein